MQKSAGVDIGIPSHPDGQQVREIIKRKLAIEPTEVISSDGSFVVKEEAPQNKKPKPNPNPKPTPPKNHS